MASDGASDRFWGFTTKQAAGTAMLAALAILFEVLNLDLRYPFAPGRVSIDPTGIPLALAAVLYGPLAGALATGIAALAILLRGNPVGATFKGIAELATVLPLALLLYVLRDRLRGTARARWAAFGVAGAGAVAARVAVMTPVNFYLLQVFFGIPPEAALVALLPLAGLNLVQGVLNVAATLLLVDRLPQDLKPSWLVGEPT